MKRLLKRILLGLALLFGLFAVASGVVLAIWWDEMRIRASNIATILEESRYSEGFSDRQEMLKYLRDHPQDFSLVSYTISKDGSPSKSAPEIRHQQREASPLASTKKVVVLAAYAREISEGNLDPEEGVHISEWERYYLPNTDGGAHPDALRKLGLETEENGAAKNPQAEVPLSEVAQAMIRSSDNAATDYLITRLGEDRIQAVIEDTGLEGQEPILPLLGNFLLWFDLDSGDSNISKQLSGERLKELQSLSEEEYAARVKSLTRAYAEGEIGDRWREDGPPTGPLRYQEDVTREFETKGTAEDYARIMAGVSSGEFISPEVSGIMRQYLDWPMEKKGNKEKFRDFGAKGGSLVGVLNQATFAVPKKGDFADETRITVIFVRQMPLSAWLGAQKSDGFNDFLLGLATNKEFAEKANRELEAR